MARTSSRSYKSYKIRKFQNGRSTDGRAFVNYAITVPTEIATTLPLDIKYICEVDDEGIHFRPTTLVDKPRELPEWAQKAAENGSGQKPKRGRPRPGKQEEDQEPVA